MMSYHKTTVEIDTEALAAAETALGTRGIKETVNRALAEAGRRAALEHAAQYVATGKLRLPDESIWSAWREPRTE
jgi:Arc/MetJ family transcription regulator